MASAEAAVETAKLNEHSLHLSGREIGFDSLWDHQQNRNTVRNRAISFFSSRDGDPVRQRSRVQLSAELASKWQGFGAGCLVEARQEAC